MVLSVLPGFGSSAAVVLVLEKKSKGTRDSVPFLILLMADQNAMPLPSSKVFKLGLGEATCHMHFIMSLRATRAHNNRDNREKERKIEHKKQNSEDKTKPRAERKDNHSLGDKREKTQARRRRKRRD